MGDMRDMADLRLHFNNLTGPVHDEIYNMRQLKRIDLYDCSITGTISPLISKWRVLEVYRIRDNQFTGTIPSELGACTRLEELWMHMNDLTGTVPDQVCELVGPRGIQIFDADCGATSGILPPKLQCECCTGCCDSDTGFCLREDGGFQSGNSRLL